MKAELCPVCRGSGRYVEREPHNIFSPTNIKPKILKDEPCHGCKDDTGVSRGWVLIPESNPLRPTPRVYPRHPDVSPRPFYDPLPLKPFHIGDPPHRRIPQIGDPPYRRIQPLRGPTKRWYDETPNWKYKITCGLPHQESRGETYCIM